MFLVDLGGGRVPPIQLKVNQKIEQKTIWGISLLGNADKKNHETNTTTELARKALGEEQAFPFTLRIVNAPPPKKFNPSKFNVYNGQTDPADHVHYYKHVMDYWTSDDAVMCRMFPASLGDSTLRWFTKLSGGQIDNFIELSE